MNDTLKLMLKMYKMGTMDWLGYDNFERYSFHHIQKRCDGGKQTITNGSPLHISSHAYLHTIENFDPDKYIFLNTVLKAINEQKTMPSIEQLKQIKLVLLEFQNEYESKLNSKGKEIIKNEYKIDEYDIKNIKKLYLTKKRKK